MKIIVLAILSITILFKPLLPVVEYIINYEYIINVLCENKDKPELKCNGKCYLSKQLAKESQNNEENPYNSLDKTDISIVFYRMFQSDFDFSLFNTYAIEHNFNSSKNLYAKLFVIKKTPPPKFI